MTEFDVKFKAENTEFNTNFGEVSIVAGDYIPVPSTAEVGQIIVVKAVDENGKPTEWEAVDLPNNEKFIVTFSGEGSPYVCDKTMDEIVNAYENGQDISAYFTGKAPNGQTYTNLLLSLTRYDPGAYIRFESDIEINNLCRIGASIDATGFCDVFEDTALDNSLTNNSMAANAKAVGDALARKQDTLIQSGAAIGQIAKITAVDSNGKPTAWEAVDMPGGSVGGQVFDEVVTLSEAVNEWSIDVPEGITDVKLRISIPAVEANMTYGFILTNGAQSNFVTINWGSTSAETLSGVAWEVFKNGTIGLILGGTGQFWQQTDAFKNFVKSVTELSSIGIKAYGSQTFPVGTKIAVRGRS